MTIDFSNIAEEQVFGFKGGEGEALIRTYVDDRARVMRITLKPGASGGCHEHATNCEVIMVLDGEMTFYDNDEKEIIGAGVVHYCPMGHRHWFVNHTDRDVHYLAIVI